MSFSSSYSSFLLSFIQHYKSDIVTEYKLISEIFSKILQIDLENVFERFKIVTSSSTVDMLIKLQGIQLNILSKIEGGNFSELYTEDVSLKKIVQLNKIYDKYKLANEENSLMNGVFQFELEKTMPKFIKYFSDKELKELFFILLNFTDSSNNNLRKTAKNILHEFIKLNLVKFYKFNEES